MKSLINRQIIRFILSIVIIISIIQPSYSAKLELKIGNDPYYKPGETVVVDLFVSNLGSTWVNGCQALMGYSSYHFGVPQQVVPGGGVWQELIYVLFNDSLNSLDAAIGVTLDPAIIGTNQNSTVAKLYFTAYQEGATKVTFRNDVNDTYATMLSDIYANPVMPVKVESPFIYIDGTAPDIDVSSIKQNNVEVSQNSSTVYQGILDIYIDATDNLSGFSNPQVLLTFSDNTTAIADYIEVTDDTYHYQYNIAYNTPNGNAEVKAMVTDRSGNSSEASSSIFINKNQINGIVSFETKIGINYSFYRQVTFKATNNIGVVTKTWIKNLNFVNSPVSRYCYAVYTLNSVPDGTMHLSAKTNWHLRQRNYANIDINSQGYVDFTLLGGDLNNDNKIQTLDYSLLKINWFSIGSNNPGNINGDNATQTIDYSIMKINWYLLGDGE